MKKQKQYSNDNDKKTNILHRKFLKKSRISASQTLAIQNQLLADRYQIFLEVTVTAELLKAFKFCILGLPYKQQLTKIPMNYLNMHFPNDSCLITHTRRLVTEIILGEKR